MEPIRILLIDNYDSYTFNLYQGLAEVSGGSFPEVIKGDELDWEALSTKLQSDAYHGVVLSPGPGTPANPTDIGVCMPLLASQPNIPVLGVCLGMQALALQFGASVRRARCGPKHGCLSPVVHSDDELFAGIPEGDAFQVVRYHSLEVPETSLPVCLETLARVAGSPGDQTVMAIKHRDLPYYGVQFHPESICTAYGPALLFNFLRIVSRFHGLKEPTVPRDVLLTGPPGRPPTLGDATAAQVSDVESVTESVPAKSLCATYSCKRDLFDRHTMPMQGVIQAIFEGLFYVQEEKISSWWLDSSLQERGGRWSFMGGAHEKGLLWRHVSYSGGGLLQEGIAASLPEDTHNLGTQTFWDWLDEDMQQYATTIKGADELPFDFCGGWLGYLGYELRHELQPGKKTPPVDQAHEPPHASLIWADRFLAIDGYTGEVYAVCVHSEGRPREKDDAEAWSQQMIARVAQVVEQYIWKSKSNNSTPASAEPSVSQTPSELSLADFLPREPQEVYLENIQACMDAMLAGDSYELCLTTQLRRQGAPEAWPLYKQLRSINPAPYAAWLDFGGTQLACSSPELFLRGDRKGMLEAKPIKGTAPRFKNDPALDAQSARALQESEKERAENLMVVDLLRNDLGRVCAPGTVHVPSLIALESFSSVHQLVSTIRGQRSKGATTVDCLRASFPGGSMTGAPKVRSMQILGDLEGGPRGVYSGCIGYMSPNGAFALNIVIRTAVIHNNAISIGAGGAITVQSDPQAEWDEMKLKAQALIRAIHLIDESREDQTSLKA